MAPVSRLLMQWLGPQPAIGWQWTVAFGGTFLLLLPATAAMGATLPAMERIVGTARAHRAPVALLYAANTFGAVLGVLGAAFVLVPWLGLIGTALCLRRVEFLLRGDGVEIRAASRRWRRLRRAAAPRLCPRSRSPGCSALATKCWWCAFSARSPKTPSSLSRSCWPSTWSAPHWAPPCTRGSAILCRAIRCFGGSRWLVSPECCR